MNDKIFELKVGIFILIGILILFIIVFSIGDINLVKSGYHIGVTFKFANGISDSAPVRLAGVDVGQVEDISIFYDENDKRAKARIHAWIRGNAKIEEDAKITINTLGLLGEKYLEIFPGTPGKRFLENGDEIVGHDPVPVEKMTEELKGLSASMRVVVDRLKNGEGTVGKLLTEEKVYNDLEAFVEDIRKHPWKLLSRPSGRKRKDAR